MSVTRKPVLLLDGGLGTTLQASPYNQVFDTTTPTWSSHLLINQRQTVQDAQADFAKAGADILLTATYQASFEGFARTAAISNGASSRSNGEQVADCGPQQAAEYMRSAVTIAREAGMQHKRQGETTSQKKCPSVALSIGPYGAILVPSQEYSGVYPEHMTSRNALQKWHADRLAVFTQDKDTWDSIDYLSWETMKNTTEVLAAREIMATMTDKLETNGGHGKKWWISTVWPDEPDCHAVDAMIEAMLADDPREMKSSVAGSSGGKSSSEPISAVLPTPWAIGINCTAVEKLETLISSMQQSIEQLELSGRWAKSWPWLVIYPNGSSDLKYDSTTMEWIPSGIQKDARAWDDALWDIVENACLGKWSGILVGGCCMTTPREIAKLRRHIDRRAASHE